MRRAGQETLDGLAPRPDDDAFQPDSYAICGRGALSRLVGPS